MNSRPPDPQSGALTKLRHGPNAPPASLQGPLLAFGYRGLVDWSGWAIFGLVATVLLTGILASAQLLGWTRMDLTMMLGTIFTPRIERARAFGVLAHLAAGQVFALLYALGFARLGRSDALIGGIFGLLHGVAALVLIVPFLPGVHPRMAAERSGPELSALEPPGFLALNFGVRTPAVTLVAHVVFGVTLGILLQPR